MPHHRLPIRFGPALAGLMAMTVGGNLPFDQPVPRNHAYKAIKHYRGNKGRKARRRR